MTSRPVRWCYSILLRLHPTGFRQRFAGEMLATFDEAIAAYGVPWLLADAVASLLRQRVIRAFNAVEDPAATATIGLMAGTYPTYRPPHLTVGKLSLAFLLSLLLIPLIQPYSMDLVPLHVKQVHHALPK
jgi:hypothetical protein